MSSLKHFFKESIIYGVATVLPRVINFLLVNLHTNTLQTEKYAENTDFYIWASLFAIVLTLGFETTFFRYYKDQKLRTKLVGTAMLALIGWVGIFLVLFTVFFPWIQQTLGFGSTPFRLKVFMSIMALDTLALIPFAYLRASRKPVKYASIKLINVGIIVSIQLLALKYIPLWESQGNYSPKIVKQLFTSLPKVEYIFVSNLFGSAISLILVLPFLFKFKWQWSISLWRKMLHYSYPIVIAGLAYAINENLDKWLIGAIIDKHTEGIYAATYKLAIFMNLYIMAFRLGAEPLFFNISKEKNAPKTYANIMTYFIILGSLALVTIVLFIDIFKYFINDNYWGALDIVPIVLLANLCLGIYHNLSIWYKLSDKTQFGMYFSVIGAALTIIINLTFLPKYGYITAAYATLIAYGVMMILSYHFGKKHYAIPYHLGITIGVLVCSIIISFFSFYIFKTNIATNIIIFTAYLSTLLWVGFKYWKHQNV